MVIPKKAVRGAPMDREFSREHGKVVGEHPTPLLPQANGKAIRELPPDPEIVELFKKLDGPLLSN